MKTGNQPARRRKDHYLPQAYLRGFIDAARQNHNKPLWCLNRKNRTWESKSPAEICYFKGMYDLGTPEVDIEHPDAIFQRLENDYSSVIQGLCDRKFQGWSQSLDFLKSYLDMIRLRSPLYFSQELQRWRAGTVGRVVGVTEDRRSLSNVEEFLPLHAVQNVTLSKMNQELMQQEKWLSDFDWQVRTTFDPFNPVVTSELPIIVVGEFTSGMDPVTSTELSMPGTEVHFPLCWQAAMVGRREPWPSNLRTFSLEELYSQRRRLAKSTPYHLISPQIVGTIFASDQHDRRKLIGDRL